MFDLGRELKRLFRAHSALGDLGGVTGGDSALLELLDLKLLLREGKAAEAAACSPGVKHRPQRRLQAAMIWREVARRTGDVVHLRKAAATAEAATAQIDRNRRPDVWSRARSEQALCAMAGSELFGEGGLTAAAEAAFREARSSARNGCSQAIADLGLAVVSGREKLGNGSVADAVAIAERIGAALVELDLAGRRTADARLLAAEARLMRADLLCGFGARLKDDGLLNRAIEDAADASARVNADYEPLIWARAEAMRGQALTLKGELTGDMDAVATAATVLSGALEHLTRDHSPLDWARTQLALAEALQVLAEACGDHHALEQAVTCFDRANLVLRDVPAMPLRGVAARSRAVCLSRLAEMTGDLAVLDVAEAAMKIELSTLKPKRDPVAWGVAQLHLASLYEARIDLAGYDPRRRAAAVLALEAALDVFVEEGLHSLTNLAADALDRLQEMSRATRRV